MGLVSWVIDCCWWQRLQPGDRTQTSYSRTAWREPRMGHKGPYLKNTWLTWHLPYTWK